MFSLPHLDSREGCAICDYGGWKHHKSSHTQHDAEGIALLVSPENEENLQINQVDVHLVLTGDWVPRPTLRIGCPLQLEIPIR